MKRISLIALALLFIMMFSIQVHAGELHDAVKNGDIVKVRQLLERGADVNARNENGTTPLHFAARYGNTDIAKLLIERGADVNAKKEGTPLHWAIYHRNTDIAKLLIEKGADLNALDESYNTPIEEVVILGRIEVAKLLIEKGADINSMLNMAASSRYTDIAKLLIEKGADVNARDNGQRTPLHNTAFSGNTDMAKLLMEKGADVNVKDGYDKTPAMVAEQHNYPELAAMLRKQGGSSVRQEFNDLVQNSSYSSWDVATIVRLAHTLNPPPAVPQEARDEMVKGMVAFKMAKRPEDFAEAEAHFSKASKLAPWLPEPYFNLALAQEKLALARGEQYKFNDAKNSLEKYLIAVTDPKDTQAGKQKMAELDLQIKRYQEFADETHMGVEAYQKGPNGYNDAIKHWRKAIEIYPDHPEADMAYYNLGEVYMNQGDLDAAYKYMQKSFELVPEPSDQPGRYTNMGVVLERRGDRAKACIYYKKGCDHGSKVSCANMSNCP